MRYLLVILILLISSCSKEPVFIEKDPLVTQLEDKMFQEQSYQDLEKELSWLKQMSPLDRLAKELREDNARFIAISNGWQSRVPGLRPELQCLANPAARHTLSLGDVVETIDTKILALEESFIAPYNEALSKYLVHAGWDCEN